MSTLKLIHDNATDTSTIVASSTAGNLTVANLKNDLKSSVHRSTTTSVSYTLTWTSPISLGGVGLPATNLTAEGQIRIRGYNSNNVLVADSGLVYAAPGRPLGLWDWAQPINTGSYSPSDWGSPINANAFAFGWATKACIWFENHYSISKLVIDLVDSNNPAGYIDCSRIVCGSYWKPSYNPDYGGEVNIIDMTVNTRNDAGDNLSDRGAVYDTMNLNLSWLPASDRSRMMQIIRGNGVSKPVLVSVLTFNEDTLLEQDWTIYGKRQNSGISFSSFSTHSSQITLEGW